MYPTKSNKTHTADLSRCVGAKRHKLRIKPVLNLCLFDVQKLRRCNQRIRNLFILPLSIGETALEPVDVLLGGYVSGGAFIPLDKSFVLPFLEFVFLDLINFHASGVTAIIFSIDWNRFVLRHFHFIVFLGGEVAAGTQFT